MTGRHHSCGTVYGAEIVPAAQLRLAGGQAHPHGEFEHTLRGDAGSDCSAGRSECRAHTVTGVLEEPTLVRLNGSAQQPVVRSQSRRMPRSASHRRVEPSMSVKRKVITPDAPVDSLGGVRLQEFGPCEVDLLEGVRDGFGVGHRFAHASQGSVGLVAESIAYASDRRTDLRK